MKPWKTLFGGSNFLFWRLYFFGGGLIFVWEDYFVFVCLRQGLSVTLATLKLRLTLNSRIC